MGYEETPINKKVSKDAVKKEFARSLDQFSTQRILFHLIKRHKYALMTSYALVLSVLYFLPFVPRLLTHML